MSNDPKKIEQLLESFSVVQTLIKSVDLTTTDKKDIGYSAIAIRQASIQLRDMAMQLLAVCQDLDVVYFAQEWALMCTDDVSTSEMIKRMDEEYSNLQGKTTSAGDIDKSLTNIGLPQKKVNKTPSDLN